MVSFENETLAYLKRNYNAIRYKDTDIDLFSEFTHCLKGKKKYKKTKD